MAKYLQREIRLVVACCRGGTRKFKELVCDWREPLAGNTWWQLLVMCRHHTVYMVWHLGHFSFHRLEIRFPHFHLCNGASGILASHCMLFVFFWKAFN